MGYGYGLLQSQQQYLASQRQQTYAAEKYITRMQTMCIDNTTPPILNFKQELEIEIEQWCGGILG